MANKTTIVNVLNNWKRWLIAGGCCALLLITLVWFPARGQDPSPLRGACAQEHVVQAGDTLFSLARRYNVPVEQLVALNGIYNPDRIYVGTRLCVSHSAPTATAVANQSPVPETASEHAAYHPSPVVLWNEVMLAAIRNGAPRPTVTARSLYMVHQAIYDAWTAYDATATPVYLAPHLKRPLSEHTQSNKAAAVSQAAYQMLTTLFPAYETNSHAFSTLLEMQGYKAVTEARDGTTPESIGYLAAAAVLDGRAADGSNIANKYVDLASDQYPDLYSTANSADPAAENSPGKGGFDPNHWQPLRVPTGVVTDKIGQPAIDASIPESFIEQVFLTPHWGAVTPFALLSGDQFRPPAPPQSGSDEPYVDGLGRQVTNDEAYRMQVGELLALSAALNDRHKVIAEYWADGPRSETPPGHWNALAHGISERDRLGIDEDAKLYFALNGAVLDASISAWDAKRAFDYIRPVSAIHHLFAGQTVLSWGGPDQGTQLIAAEQWRPYQHATFVTPPFAEYVSGHSTFSAAAAEVLTRFSGSNAFYDGKTVLYYEDFNNDGVPDVLGQHVVPVGGNKFETSPAEVVVLQWPTFQDAADEAGLSRRYGGIHFQDADLHGREMGTQIGALAFELAQRYWTGKGS